ncbi:MAG: Kef-type K+ transport system membrane component KefB [Flavobacteriales bacterium]|jgi:Kef-type K+ transport system membrane component KefB
MEATLIESFFLIFCSAAVAATVALYTRQPLLLAYIAMGVLLGPHVLGLISEHKAISEMSHIGIIFLLFLLGLDMQPKSLLAVMKKATSIALISCAAFGCIGFTIAYAAGFPVEEASVVAMATMFSSTIIGIKLLPTTVLHHKHTGEMMVGLLLLQDFLAIFCLMILSSGGASNIDVFAMVKALIALPLLIGLAFLGVRYVLQRLIQKFDRFYEYIFLIAIGWCLGLATLAEHIGLSAEIGAFAAGISLATSPISKYIALNLKPLRDFFLILFFFLLGAQLNIALLPDVIWVAIILAGVVLAIKPLIFYFLLRQQSERKSLAWDISFRLGQISEFSLLISILALERGLISESASLLIQTSTIITFVVSSYIVIWNFPNPIAIKESLRRD